MTSDKQGLFDGLVRTAGKIAERAVPVSDVEDRSYKRPQVDPVSLRSTDLRSMLSQAFRSKPLSIIHLSEGVCYSIVVVGRSYSCLKIYVEGELRIGLGRA
mgnify:CR=1 FL=1